MKTDGILFDLDGTLWDAVAGICVSWNQAAKNFGLDRRFTVEQLHGCMGLQMDRIAQKLFPELNADQKAAILKELCRVEEEYLSQHGGKLYPKVEETLAALAAKLPLFIVSNCQDGYIQCFLKVHGLGKYFKDFESFGATGLSKGENNRLVARRNGLKNPVYVGDTQGDAQAARAAGIPFIFASYGFGEVPEKEAQIDAFEELLPLIEADCGHCAE